MIPVLIDTSVLAYALGAEHEHRAACRRLLSEFHRTLRPHASVEMIQELVFHRLRRTDRRRAVSAGRQVAQAVTLHPFDQPILQVALSLIESTDDVRGRDAVHAATGLAIGVDAIVSTDAAFEAIPGLTWWTPTRALDELGERS